MMRRALFIDRDGTLIEEPADEQIDSIDKLQFLPGALTALARVAATTDYELVLVTNQDGLGSQTFPEDTFWPVQNLMLRTLQSVGVRFADIHIDRTREGDGAPTRKPGTAMLHRYLQGNYDLQRSLVIGDRDTDVQLARNLGARAIRLGAGLDPRADYTVSHWDDIVGILRGLDAEAGVRRTSRETDITVELRLRGEGNADIHTGIGFLDHMLEQVARHSGIDLVIRARGDLHIDEHHTVEDVALTLGDALRAALGKRAGIERYGFVLPMDESRALVAMDLSGRPALRWDVQFQRSTLGDLPTELIEHFARSLSDATRCALHVEASGSNDHHLCESIFKGLGRCLRQATTRSALDAIPSTKGFL